MKKYRKNLFTFVAMFLAFAVSFCMAPDIEAEAARGLGKAEIKSVSSPSAGKASVKYKKVKGAKGYQIQFAANSKMTKSKKRLKQSHCQRQYHLSLGKNIMSESGHIKSPGRR